MTAKPIVFFAGGSLILFALSVVIVFGDNGWLDLRALDQELHQLSEKKTAVFKENSSLLRQIERLKKDPQFIEATAKRELGVIREDELILKWDQP